MNKSLRIVLAIAALLTGIGQRALAQNTYYWAASSSGNWNEPSNWKVFTPAAPATTPASLVGLPTATTPPTANDDVIINNLASFGPGNVTINVGPMVNMPNGPTSAAAKSIIFGGTIPNNTNINFTVNQPLTVGTVAAPGSVTAEFKVAVRADESLTIYGPLTFGANAAGSSLAINQPTTITGAVTVNVPTTITTSNTFSANSLTFNLGAGNSTLAVNQQTATIADALTLSSAAAVTVNGTLKAKTLAVNAAASIIANGTLQVDDAMTVGAAATITTNNNGTLQAKTLNFTALAANLVSTLISNGTVSVTDAVTVDGRTTITVNKSFSAGSLTYNSGAGSSTFTVGRSTAPAITGATATISRAVAVGSASTTITTNASNTLSIGGDLTISNTSAIFNISGAVSLGGSLTLAAAGNITGTTGSVTFTSTATDTKIKSLGAVFTVPVTFGVANQTTRGRWTLDGNMTLARRVTFVNGYVIAKPSPDNQPSFSPTNAITNIPAPKLIVQLGTNNIAINTTTGAQLAITGGSTNSHVVGNIQLEGTSNTTVPRVTINGVQQDDVVFLPTGDGKIYRPIGLLGFSNSTTAFVARYYNFNNRPNSSALYKADPLPGFTLPNTIAAGSALNSVTSDEYWWLGKGAGSANPKIILNALHPDPLVRADYRLDKYDGLTVAGLHDTQRTWSDFNGVPSMTTWNITALDAINQNRAWFTIARRGSTPLPVRLVSFTAQQLDGQVQLKWQSASEENTSHFDVERSADGKNFSPLLTKKAQGNSGALVSYNALDNSPLGGTSYYRLKMVDLDGTFEYSNLVPVSSESTVQVRPFPNPSNGRYVQFLALNGDKLVLQSVMDAFGKPVGYETNPVYGQGLYVNFYGALPAGFYVATLVTDDNKRERVRIKFVVQ